MKIKNLFLLVLTLSGLWGYCDARASQESQIDKNESLVEIECKREAGRLELSDYVTIVITVPETHADIVRTAMGKAGAGKIGNYSYCSYSVKGVGRFMPNKGSDPYQGQQDVLEELVEERIEMVCNRSILEYVLEQIKEVHPYEETVIDIYPVYEIGRKKAK
jgi:hypothetical protein